ncbi:GNAT family N-acetyltransferase [Kitasatospora purpeofusca]|uniref:GNAT family N-acetyltransferase n=1 Tax=Kitasatospora purpeofusca TaxID=67352 RepID=UPI00099B5047|nr:GNAT family protein [Kitasatospora purpeofusca]
MSPSAPAPAPTPADADSVEPRTFRRTTLDLGDAVLRPWGRADAEPGALLDSLVAAAADPLIALWNPLPTRDPAAALTWLAAREDSWDKGTAAPFAVLDATDGALLGCVNLRWTDRADGLAMIGYWAPPSGRGRGLIGRATRAVTSWGFRTADARRIEVAHAVGNEASCRLALNCGYLPEGTLRASYRFGDGTYHDEHLHARLATDPEPAPVPAPLAAPR